MKRSSKKRRFQDEESYVVKRSCNLSDSDASSSEEVSNQSRTNLNIVDDELSNSLNNDLNNNLNNDLSNDVISDLNSSDPNSSDLNSSDLNSSDLNRSDLNNKLSNHKSSKNLEFFVDSSNQSVAGFFKNKKYEWNFKNEAQFINLNEQVNWLSNNNEKLIDNLQYPESTFDQLNLDEQYDFVSKEIYDDILKCKTALNEFSKDDIRRAKSQSNPFETISRCIFQNRSALKIANLDFLCNYMFTSPKYPLIDDKDFLYFGDLCGGPGGFTEYVFFKRCWEAKGFGLTLKGENDFNLDKLPSTSMFQKFYGDLEDGNIYKPRNLASFRNYVLNNTDKRGLHVILSDGGFSCQGKEKYQELLSKRLYLCQFLCALSLLRKGGHFVCKLFDIYSVFSVGLIYLMYRCFSRMAIIKPNTSRPATSERFIVFKSKLDDCQIIENFLFKINCSLDSFEAHHTESQQPETTGPFEYSNFVKEDFHQLISLETIKEDSTFYNYILHSNNELGKRQIHFLCKERAFALNPNLVDNSRNSLRRKCLNQWKIPSRIQSSSNFSVSNQQSAEQKFESLMSDFHINISKCAFLYYEANELKQLNSIKYPWNYFFTTLTENRDNDCQRGIYQSFKGLIFYFDTQTNKWKPCKQLDKLKLPNNTLVFAELTSEFKGEGTSQKKVAAFHIIDALILGNINVSNRPIDERIMMAEKMLRVLSIDNVNIFIRCKKWERLPEIEDYFQQLEMKECKGIRKERMGLSMDKDYFAIASGLLIYSKLKMPFGSNKSNSTNKIYYFNYKKNSESVFKCPNEAINDFISSYCERLLWKWSSELDLLPNDPDESKSDHSISALNVTKITRQSFCAYLNRILKPR